MLKHIPIAAAFILTAGAGHADNVEIYVVDLLDNIQNGYCLDIAKGQGAKADPDDGLQAHTCYSPSGEIYVDQAFDPGRFSDGVLYMPEFDVCVQAQDLSAGAAIELASCDDSDAQQWSFGGEGAIAHAAHPGLCLTLAEETRTGRSEANQMKSLSLEACADEASASQIWSTRTAD